MADPSQGWRARETQGMGPETRAMLNKAAFNKPVDDAIEALPAAEGFEEVEMSPMEMGPSAPVPRSDSTAVPEELAPPGEMTPGDSFFDLRASPGAPSIQSEPSAFDLPMEVEAAEAPMPSSESSTEIGAPLPSLAEVVANTESDQDSLLAHNSALAGEVNDLRDALNEAHQQLKQSNDRIAQLQKRTQPAAPAGPPVEVARLTNELATARGLHKELEDDLRLAREEVEHARAEQSALMAEVEALRAHAAELDARPKGPSPAELESAGVEVARLRAALDEAMARSQEREDVFKRLAAELEAATGARKELEDDLRHARDEVESGRATQAALMAEVEALHAQATALAAKPVGPSPAELQAAAKETEALRGQLEQATAAVARFQQANEELTRKVAAAETKAQDNEHARAEAQGALQHRDAEIERLNTELSLAAAAAPAPGKGKNADYEAQIKAMKKEVATKEKEAREAREALDSESARSFRLSQRRIPALQNELAEAHAQGMELRRKMEKAEAEKRVLADNAESAQRQIEELERALAAAKARMQDTTIIAPPESQTSAADEEVKRLASRLKAAEEERRKLSESLAQIDKGRRGELEKYEERLTRTQAESNERHENYLGLRKQLKLLAGRLSQTVKLANMLAGAVDDGQRQMLLQSIEKLGKETEAAAGGGSADMASLAPATSDASHSAASQAPAVGEKEKKASSRTEIISAPDVPPPQKSSGNTILHIPARPATPAAQSVGPADLVEPTAEPSAEPMSLDGPSLDPGFDGIPDDLAGPNADV